MPLGRAYLLAQATNWKDADGYPEDAALRAILVFREDGAVLVHEELTRDDADSERWVREHPKAPADFVQGSMTEQATAYLAKDSLPAATGTWTLEGDMLSFGLTRTGHWEHEFPTGNRDGFGSPVTNSLGLVGELSAKLQAGCLVGSFGTAIMVLGPDGAPVA